MGTRRVLNATRERFRPASISFPRIKSSSQSVSRSSVCQSLSQSVRQTVVRQIRQLPFHSPLRWCSLSGSFLCLLHLIPSWLGADGPGPRPHMYKPPLPTCVYLTGQPVCRPYFSSLFSRFFPKKHIYFPVRSVLVWIGSVWSINLLRSPHTYLPTTSVGWL